MRIHLLQNLQQMNLYRIRASFGMRSVTRAPSALYISYAASMQPASGAQGATNSRRSRLAAALSVAALSLAALAACGDSAELAEPSFTSAASPETSETSSASASKSSEASTTTTTEKASKAPDCSDEALRRDFEWTDVKMLQCEGGFAHAGIPNSDAATYYLQWDGNAWHQVEPNGTVYSQMRGGDIPCYDLKHLRQIGVPETIAQRMPKCKDPDSQKSDFDQAIANQPKGDPSSPYITLVNLGEAGEPASYPACDGRNILILDSVVDEGNSTAHLIAQQVLMQHPSGKPVRFTVPGQCPSLRAQVNGQDIYPIYIDFLQDTDAMCRAKATYGGNGRILSNSAEYVDPC